MRPKKRLHNIVIEEVALVDRGDNPPADIVLFKRDTRAPGLLDRLLGFISGTGTDAEIEKRILEEVREAPEFLTHEPDEGDSKGGSEMDLTKLSKEDRETVEAALSAAGELEGATEELAKQKAQIAELEAKVAKAAKPQAPKDDVTKALEKLPPELRKALADKLVARDEESAEMRKQLDELHEERAFRKYAEEVGDLTGLSGKREEHLARLWKIRDESARSEVQKSLEAAAEAIRRGGIFDERGSPLEGANPMSKGGTAMAKIRAAAAEIRKSDPKLTKEQAEARALRANPELYREYREELTH